MTFLPLCSLAALRPLLGGIAALFATFFWGLSPVQAAGRDVTIMVRDGAGTPVPGAVVFLDDKGAAVPESFGWPTMMEQSDLAFSPYVLAVPLGSEVSFPNRDRVRHHVYSFSKGNRFELELYGREDDRFIQFKRPGIVAVGCNIHDDMVGYIRVVDAAIAATSGPEGRATLTGLPDGATSLTVWHPDLERGRDVAVSVPVGSVDVAVTLGGELSSYARKTSDDEAHAHH